MQEEKTPLAELLNFDDLPCCDREAVTGYVDFIGDLLYSYKFRRTSQEWVLHSLNVYLDMSNDKDNDL